jgi:quinol monooxygenase YgiN
MILIVAKMRVRSEFADEFPVLVREFTQAVRAEPGNLGFDWHRSVEDPDRYVLVEAFRDGAAGEVHVASEHFQQAMTLLPRVLAEVPEIVNVEVPGDSGR